MNTDFFKIAEISAFVPRNAACGGNQTAGKPAG